MPAGRPRKPTALKLLHGTARSDRLNPAEPRPSNGPVEPPKWLSGTAKQAWAGIQPLLSELGVLTTADVHALGLLCDVLAEYVTARNAIRRHGHTYESRKLQEAEDGEQIVTRIVRPRPEVAMAADAWRRAALMLMQFGLTPASRSKVSAAGEPEVEDPFDQWARGPGA